MEADGEHNTRGTADQRLDQLEDLVRELFRHVVGNEYSERETPGPSGPFSQTSMSFGGSAVEEKSPVKNAIDEKSTAKIVGDALASKREVASDEEFDANSAVAEESAAKIAMDEKSIGSTPKDASDEDSVGTDGSAQKFRYPLVDVDLWKNNLEEDDCYSEFTEQDERFSILVNSICESLEKSTTVNHDTKFHLLTLFRNFSTLYIDIRDRNIRERGIEEYANVEKRTGTERAAWDYVKTLTYDDWQTILMSQDHESLQVHHLSLIHI